MAFVKALLRSFFLDVPSLIDRAWRQVDFRLNCAYRYDVGTTPPMQPRPFFRQLPFWFFAVTALYATYGPTLQGLCNFFAHPVPTAVIGLFCGISLLLILRLFFGLHAQIRARIMKRIPASDDADTWPAVRRFLGRFALWTGAFLVLLIPALASYSVLNDVVLDNACRQPAFRSESSWQFALWLLAIAAFAIACQRSMRTWLLLLVQAVLIVSLAVVQWRWLATDQATEASRLPYHHVFAVLAPVVCIALAVAPLLALFLRRTLPNSVWQFSDWLRAKELFVPTPDDPELTLTRVFHAVFHGIAYRVLQLALPPALAVLVAPADWVWINFWGGVGFALFLSTWGNFALRWRQMIMHIERWFLSGAAFFVSVFVIAIAGARLYGVDYVTTILDAAYLGVVASAVLMTYMLSWLMEYWLNRVIAVELLRVLAGNKSGQPGPDQPMIPYYPDKLPNGRQPEVEVELKGSYLMCSGIGRFVVVGHQTKERGAPAFHSYDLLELFREIAGDTRLEPARDVSRHTFLYFFVMNLLLAGVIGWFCWYGYRHMTGDPVRPDEMVRARADHGGAGLKDLADRLLANPDDERPAIVVAASGGGTRAALYTAHVLEGLHKKGATPDVVLVSGVSGGGVALAYYVANYDRLEKDKPPYAEWERYRRRVARNFIRDVMEGASEWRILGTTPLSALLAESFQQRLLHDTPLRPQNFAFAGTPGLILNTAVTGHPAEDSQVLAAALNAVPQGNCHEQVRPYNMMHGGRLIFTNLQDTGAFPRRGDNRIPDVRLPYQIIKDPTVLLSSAAALNANFPPVFPNARVIIEGLAPDPDCRNREFYVTDGGAEENLGLVSALFAVRSALERIKERCVTLRTPGKADAWCDRKLRPIHFVLAEASAAGYDYQQDRGFSAAIGGSKERMTGGLTNQLIEANNTVYRSLPRSARATQELEFHYLALPLVFRARGGFGTHWMHAEHIAVSDPRLRVPARRILPWTTNGDIVTLRKDDVSVMWSALHDPQAPFCGQPKSGNERIARVREWICGDGGAPRDLHIEAWQALLKRL